MERQNLILDLQGSKGETPLYSKSIHSWVILILHVILAERHENRWRSMEGHCGLVSFAFENGFPPLRYSSAELGWNLPLSASGVWCASWTGNCSVKVTEKNTRNCLMLELTISPSSPELPPLTGSDAPGSHKTRGFSHHFLPKSL